MRFTLTKRIERCLLFLVCYFAVFSVSCTRPEPYSTVPEELRSRLDGRLKLLVENMRAERYDKTYDLFSDSYINQLKEFHRSSKAEYLAAINNMPKTIPAFDDFIPKSTVNIAADAYRISGIIVSRYNNQSFENDASIEARWQKGNWYFSEFRDERKR